MLGSELCSPLPVEGKGGYPTSFNGLDADVRISSCDVHANERRYADFCWQALAEFPGILLAWVGLDNRRTGRRGTMVLSFSVGGVACGLMIFLQKAPAGARTVMVRHTLSRRYFVNSLSLSLSDPDGRCHGPPP